MNGLTEIIEQISSGDSEKSEQLFSIVYDELRQLAAAKLANERAGHSLQATALVHETYLRLLDGGCELEWNSRGHFFAAAGEAMRRILVEHARQRLTAKRGGGRQRVAIEIEQLPDGDSDQKIVNLSSALERLETIDERKALVVKLRFFAGLTIEETAKNLNLSTSTVERTWTFAKAWLQHEMSLED